MNDSVRKDKTITFEWVSHPLKQSYYKSILAIGSVIASAILCGYFMDSPGFGLLGGVVLFLSLGRFFFPTRYKLDRDGISVKTITTNVTHKWSRYRSMYPDRNGALLSPFMGPSRLESFRGLYITFTDNREQIVEFIRARLESELNEISAQQDNKS
ncbi:MAG: hypothetical protein IIB00_04860 [candidate division Zixibacteria bacterium]|nr:hypothetical protein [candidate division Zixibacteria bacterium]